ncbi:hypothetical protein QR680_006677 [Steinernema hermaphroditum]|uniref:Protein amnionless n=1 Tax=Steinernema hermaphroditum TaxID=289476 RepID=A0AA39HXS5_9BILA|nr:hypothetical protein QR680_006677 [Steinernema hermaphroditum]
MVASSIFLITFVFIFQNALCEVFVFRSAYNMENAKNWQDIPCQNDHAVFEPEKIVVTMLSQGIDVNMISLPNDGVIFFDKRTTLGKKGDFQCQKRAKSEDAFFTGGVTYLNYYDHQNWESKSNNSRPRLHAQRVPGSQDVAVFDKQKPAQIQINQNVRVGELFFGGVTTRLLGKFVEDLAGPNCAAMAREYGSAGDSLIMYRLYKMLD